MFSHHYGSSNHEKTDHHRFYVEINGERFLVKAIWHRGDIYRVRIFAHAPEIDEFAPLPFMEFSQQGAPDFSAGSKSKLLRKFAERVVKYTPPIWSEENVPCL